MRKKSGQYSRDELKQIVTDALTQSDGWESDSLDFNRIAAQKAYLGMPRGDELPGRAYQQSLDTGDMTNACLSQLTPMLSTDVFVSFEPNDEADEETAEAESRAVNKVIMDDQQGYIKFMLGIKEALLYRNGVIRVWMEETERESTMQFDNLNDEAKAYILNDIKPNQEMVITSDEGGTTKFRLTTTTRTPTIQHVHIRDFLVTNAWHEQSVQDAPFVAQRHRYTRSQLIEMGFDKKDVDELPSDQPTFDAIRRDENNDRQSYSWETDEITVYECFILLDMGDEGIARRYRIHYANETLLGEFEPFGWVPFATGTGILYPNEWLGESLYDRLKDVQDSKTWALRSWLDNLKSGNNVRVAMDGTRVNMDDATNTRPGAIIRTKGAPSDSIFPLPVMDMGTSAEALLTYQDKIRTERGGAALDMMGAQEQLVGDTAHGIERQYSSRELMVQMIGKSLAETLIRETYVLMHQTLRLQSNEPLAMKHQGQWIQMDPQEWPARNRVNVIIGQTAGQRNAAQQALFMFIQSSVQMMQTPMAGVLFDQSSIYRAMQDWLKMAGVDNPERLLIDPTSPAAQQAAQQHQQGQEQQQQQQMQLWQMEKQFEKYQHDTDLRFNYFKELLSADLKEGETIANLEMEAAKMVSSNANAEQDRTAAANGSAAGNGKGGGK